MTHVRESSSFGFCYSLGELIGETASRYIYRNRRLPSGETLQRDTSEHDRSGCTALQEKGDGQPAKLCYIGHALMENRHGLGVRADHGPA